MTRKQILTTAALVFLVTLFGVIILVLGVFCVPIMLAKPSLTEKPQEFVMTRITREVSKIMFRVGPRMKRAALCSGASTGLYGLLSAECHLPFRSCGHSPRIRPTRYQIIAGMSCTLLVRSNSTFTR
jgi:hypothetical protein